MRQRQSMAWYSRIISEKPYHDGPILVVRAAVAAVVVGARQPAFLAGCLSHGGAAGNVDTGDLLTPSNSLAILPRNRFGVD